MNIAKLKEWVEKDKTDTTNMLFLLKAELFKLQQRKKVLEDRLKGLEE